MNIALALKNVKERTEEQNYRQGKLTIFNMSMQEKKIGPELSKQKQINTNDRPPVPT